MTELIQRILPSVQKPARYTGGEFLGMGAALSYMPEETDGKMHFGRNEENPLEKVILCRILVSSFIFVAARAM